MKPPISPRLILILFLSIGLFIPSFSQDEEKDDVFEKFNSIQISKEKNYTTSRKYLKHNGKPIMHEGKLVMDVKKKFNCKFNITDFIITAKDAGKGNKKSIQISFNYNLTYNTGYENAVPQDSSVYIAFCFPNDSILLNLEVLNTDNYFDFKDNKLIKLKRFDTYPVEQHVVFNLKLEEIIAGEYRVKFWNSACLISEYYFLYEE